MKSNFFIICTSKTSKTVASHDFVTEACPSVTRMTSAVAAGFRLANGQSVGQTVTKRAPQMPKAVKRAQRIKSQLLATTSQLQLRRLHDCIKLTCSILATGYQVNECEFMCGYFGTRLQMDTLRTDAID